MREILYRGKRIDSGEWVYGVAFPHDNCGKVTIAMNTKRSVKANER